jgi:hypothetical protein
MPPIASGVEGVHGEEKAWHGLARAVRRGLANMKIQAHLTADSRKSEEIGGRNRALTHAMAHSRSYTATW